MKNIYVCQLPQNQQSEIVALAKKKLSKLAYSVNIDKEIENALNSKLSDLTELIGYDELIGITK